MSVRKIIMLTKEYQYFFSTFTNKINLKHHIKCNQYGVQYLLENYSLASLISIHGSGETRYLFSGTKEQIVCIFFNLIEFAKPIFFFINITIS